MFKSLLITVAAMLTIWAAWVLLARRARGQICASAGCGSLDSGSLSQEPCLNDFLNYLEDGSSCSGTDECGNTGVTLQWGLEYDGGACTSPNPPLLDREHLTWLTFKLLG